MLFCPTCGSLLLVEKENEAGYRFYCRICPYVYNITKKVTMKTTYERKQVDDILGGLEDIEHAQKTAITCPKCGYDTAIYKEIQTRSADEPATIFYRCHQAPQQRKHW